jgi:hypothetical protein
MQSKPICRRELLKMAAIILAVSGAASKVLAAPCASLDGADSGLRNSLHYTESAADPSQRCSGCGFFSNPQGACGQCAIFNGAANAGGHCDSWAARS